MIPGRLVMCLVGMLLLGGVVAVANAEEVSMSRYRETVGAPPNTTARAAIDNAVLDAFCQDEDGCQAVLFYELSGVRLFADTRLMVSSAGFGWATSTSSTINIQTISADTVISKGLEGTCRFSDVETDGNDTTAGFTVAAEAASEAIICTLTLID